MAAGYDIAKAGWLHRESSVLHRWKTQWFVLDKLGDLRYFDTPDHPVAEERLVVRAVVRRIRTGAECGSVSIPDNLSKASVLILDMTNGSHMTLCAETPDDMKAWQMALDEARTAYNQSPQNVHAMGNTTIINHPMNTTTVVAGPGVYGGYGTYGGYYSGYPGRVISTPGVTVLPAQPTVTCVPGGTTVVNAAAPQQVVYMNRSPYYRRGIFDPYLW